MPDDLRNDQRQQQQQQQQKQQGRKRVRSFPRREPAFLDATASLLAAPFATARLPEIQALYHHQISSSTTRTATKATTTIQSRHLRRRVTSFNPKHGKRHRYPRGDYDDNNNNDKEPSTKQAKRTLTNTESEQEIPETTKATKQRSRKALRGSSRWLKSKHELWKQQQPQQQPTENRTTNTNTSSDSAMTTTTAAAAEATTTPMSGVHWIPTHLWHAKRFHMERLWGWKVPILHTNRGAKAVLRLAQTPNKCLIQDITWRMQPILSLRTTTFETLAASLARVIPEWAEHRMAITSSSSSSSTIGTKMVGHGMLYPPDCAPLGAMGPISWIITTAPPPPETKNDTVTTTATTSTSTTKTSDVSPDRKIITIHLLVHPAIRDESLDCLQQVLSSSSAVVHSENSTTTERTACCWSYFTLRGGGPHSAKTCLVRALEQLKQTKAVTMLQQQQQKQTIELGGILTTTLRLPQTAPECVQDTTATTEKEGKNDEDEYELWIIPVAPRLSGGVGGSSEDRSNWGVCGLDLVVLHSGDYTTAASSMLVWNALVVAGGACPMGLTEEVHLAMECHPPLPLFPRDYPDTNTGQAYWSLASSSSSQNNDNDDDNNSEWKVVRHYWEGGVGRISSTPSPNSSTLPATLNWNAITTLSDDDNNDDNNTSPSTTSIAMIRGGFGKPILDLMCSTTTRPLDKEEIIMEDPNDMDGAVAPVVDQNKNKKRQRRPSRNPTAMVRIPPPDRVLRSHFQSQCQVLWESLTLPAVLLTHVRVELNGILWPGAALYATTTSASPMLLGHVTCHVFSPTRGRCHGMAVVGAARFLKALSVAHNHQHDQQQTLIQARDFVNGAGDNHNHGPATTRLLAQVRQSPQHAWYQVSLSLVL